MNSNTPKTWPLWGVAALLCSLSCANALAAGHAVTDTIQVSTQGLDLNRPSDALRLYTRLKDAAYVLCTRGTRVGLAPVDDFKDCYETTLGNAIRSAKAPMVTQMYLQTHTLRDAIARGIEIPAQLAAK